MQQGDEESRVAPEVSNERESYANLLDALRQPLIIRSIALTILATIAMVAVLYLAKAFLVPVFVAVFLYFLLSPVVRFLVRRHMPPVVGATFVVGGLLVSSVGLAIYLAEPAERWFSELPEVLEEASGRLDDLREPVEAMRETVDLVEGMTSIDEGDEEKVVVERDPGAATILLEEAGAFASRAFVAFALLYLMLLSYDSILRKVVSVLPRLRDKKLAVEVFRGVESEISRYILTTSAINLVLGSFIGLSLYLIGMPNAVLWGVMAALLNFVPYIGAAVGMGVIALVSLATFDTLSPVFAAVLSYLSITSFEGALVTPLILGRRFRISAVIVFLWVLFWFWLWGVPGGLFAMPILVGLKIVCDNFERLKPISVLIGR